MVRCRFVAKRASDNAAMRGIQIKRRDVVKPGGNTEPALPNEPAISLQTEAFFMAEISAFGLEMPFTLDFSKFMG